MKTSIRSIWKLYLKYDNQDICNYDSSYLTKQHRFKVKILNFYDDNTDTVKPFNQTAVYLVYKTDTVSHFTFHLSKQ